MLIFVYNHPEGDFVCAWQGVYYIVKMFVPKQEARNGGNYEKTS